MYDVIDHCEYLSLATIIYAYVEEHISQEHTPHMLLAADSTIVATAIEVWLRSTVWKEWSNKVHSLSFTNELSSYLYTFAVQNIHRKKCLA